jgi:hypothetical protein
MGEVISRVPRVVKIYGPSLAHQAALPKTLPPIPLVYYVV